MGSGFCDLHPEIKFWQGMDTTTPPQGQWPQSLVNNIAQHNLVSRGDLPGAACALATRTAQHLLCVMASSSGHRVASHCSARQDPHTRLGELSLSLPHTHMLYMPQSCASQH